MYESNIIFVILGALCVSVNTLERELTVHIEAGREDCFFQGAKEGEKIDFEYQVIDGDYSELSITFHLVDPTGRILVADYRKAENTHRLHAQLTGDYKFCFDNTHSRFHVKTIFFELIIEKEDQEEEWDIVDQGYGELNEEVYEITMEEIQDAANKVRHNLKNIRHFQEMIKSSEARDRNIAEENYRKINSFSGIQVMVMLVVGVTQVVMLRALFDDKSKVRTVWKKIQNAR